MTKSERRPWVFVICIFAAFVLMPEVRRVVDYRTSFNPFNVFSIVGPLMIVPLALAYARRMLSLRTAGAYLLFIWLGSCAYGLIAAAIQREILPGLYGVLTIALPAIVGLWFLTRKEPSSVLFERFSLTLLALGAIAGGYGIFQYVVAPAWDTAWMASFDTSSFGEPVPFGIRVFSVLNSPGTLASFLACVLLVNLPHLTFRKPWYVAAAALNLACLILTFGRAAWLAVAFGLIAYLIVSPLRVRAFSTVVIFAAVIGAALAILSVTPNDDLNANITQRLSSLTDVTEDTSVSDRQESARGALNLFSDSPLGTGIGTSGLGSELGTDSGSFFVIDNGYLTQLVEMGLPGFLAQIVTIFGTLVLTLVAVLASSRKGDIVAAQNTAALFALEVGIAVMQASGPEVGGLMGVLFFTALGIAAHTSRATEADVTVPSLAARRAA